MKIILIKYGELTTKGANRNLFINILYNNIKKALENYNVRIIKNRVRMFIETEDNIDDIKKISAQVLPITEPKVENNTQQNTAWGKMKSFVRKAVDCCIE